MRDPIEDTNTILAASDGPLSASRLRAAIPSLAPGLRRTAREAAGRIEPPLPGGAVYTDDRAPVEWLIDESIVDYAAGGD